MVLGLFHLLICHLANRRCLVHATDTHKTRQDVLVLSCACCWSEQNWRQVFSSSSRISKLDKTVSKFSVAHGRRHRRNWGSISPAHFAKVRGQGVKIIVYIFYACNKMYTFNFFLFFILFYCKVFLQSIGFYDTLILFVYNNNTRLLNEVFHLLTIQWRFGFGRPLCAFTNYIYLLNCIYLLIMMTFPALCSLYGNADYNTWTADGSHSCKEIHFYLFNVFSLLHACCTVVFTARPHCMQCRAL